jgi:nitric oxide dioxygenase
MKGRINKLIEYPEKGILSKNLVKNDKLDVALFCMAEGTEISEHASAKQGFVYVIEGSGVFNLEGEDIAMSSGVFIRLKENAPHSLKVDKDTSFLLVLTNA